MDSLLFRITIFTLILVANPPTKADEPKPVEPKTSRFLDIPEPGRGDDKIKEWEKFNADIQGRREVVIKERGLKYDLFTTTETILCGHAIYLRCRLQNTSDKEITILSHNIYNLERNCQFAVLERASGDLVEMTRAGRTRSPYRDYEIYETTIAPGEKLEWKFLLSRYFDMTRPGNYSVYGGFRIFEEPRSQKTVLLESRILHLVEGADAPPYDKEVVSPDELRVKRFK